MLVQEEDPVERIEESRKKEGAMARRRRNMGLSQRVQGKTITRDVE